MASNEKTPRKAGRPKKQINKKQFIELCELQCTQEEIASFFDCSADTINNWCKAEFGVKYSEVFKKYKQGGKISLRRSQMKLAERSATMAIWLGKQMLDQEDRVIVETIDQSVINDIEKQVILGVDEDGDHEDTGD